MITNKIIQTGYYPRFHQNQLHGDLKRFNVLVCHRRFGKTVFALNEMIDQGLRCKKHNPRYAYIAPTYGQAKRVAWDYLKEFTQHLPNREVNESELRVDIKRPDTNDIVRFTLLGAENPTAILGLYLDGVILDEVAEMMPEVWTRIVRPTLTDRTGWAIFIGTPRGMNHFYHLYQDAGSDPEWYRAIFKASETKILIQKELDSSRKTMSEEEYNQEFECDFTAALVGAYYGKLLKKAEEEKRVCNVAYDPSSPVNTYWDLGMSDSTSIWCVQEVGKEMHIIDYYENSNVELSEYAKWLKARPYVIEECVLPHDAAARSLETGKTREEVLRKLGFRTRILPKSNVQDGINAVRVVLNQCWFDEQKTKRGLDALKNYTQKWDSKNNIWSTAPLHNWASHGADAFRTFAMGYRSSALSQRVKSLPRKTENKHSIF